jgi:hypothetical protein
VDSDRVIYFHDRHPRVGEHQKLLEQDQSYRALVTRARLGQKPPTPDRGLGLHRPRSPSLDV